MFVRSEMYISYLHNNTNLYCIQGLVRFDFLTIWVTFILARDYFSLIYSRNFEQLRILYILL